MKVLSVGNMAEDGLLTTLALRHIGIDADLLVNAKDFAAGYPEWELGEFGRDIFTNGKNEMIDPYNLDQSELADSWERPNWIQTLKGASLSPRISPESRAKHKSTFTLLGRIWRRVKFALTYFELFKHATNYDIVEAHVPYPIHLQYMRKPYLVYEAGWIRSLVKTRFSHAFQMGFEVKLALNAYRKANHIIYTNPDMYDIFQESKLIPDDKLSFVPFAIDTDRYKPVDASDVRHTLAPNDEFTILQMSRQDWSIKGSDRMINAFYRFNKAHPKSKLVLISWGADLLKSKTLVEKLGITKNVVWVPMLPKSKLILLYNAVDIAFDQFLIGVWGTSFPECVSCGTPVLMYWDKMNIMRAFGSIPPIPSVETEDDVLDALITFSENRSLRDELGRKGRDWIIQTHGMEKVGRMHEKILRNCLDQI